MQTKVPVGAATVAGYTGTFLGPIAFILSQFLPDQDQQTIAELATAVLTIGSFLVTQVGRYAQAHALAKKAVVLPVPVQANPVVEGQPSPVSADGDDSVHQAGEGIPDA